MLKWEGNKNIFGVFALGNVSSAMIQKICKMLLL